MSENRSGHKCCLLYNNSLSCQLEHHLLKYCFPFLQLLCQFFFMTSFDFFVIKEVMYTIFSRKLDSLYLQMWRKKSPIFIKDNYSVYTSVIYNHLTRKWIFICTQCKSCLVSQIKDKLYFYYFVLWPHYFYIIYCSK